MESSLRVYDADLVDAHVRSMQTTIDDLQVRLDDALNRLTRAQDPTQIPTGVEAMIGRTMLMAQRAADEAMTRATDEASKVRERARVDAEAIMARARQQALRSMDDDDRRGGPAAVDTPAPPGTTPIRRIGSTLSRYTSRLSDHPSGSAQSSFGDDDPFADPADRWRSVRADQDMYADLRPTADDPLPRLETLTAPLPQSLPVATPAPQLRPVPPARSRASLALGLTGSLARLHRRPTRFRTTRAILDLLGRLAS